MEIKFRHAPIMFEVSSFCTFFFFFFPRVLGLLICPKIAEAKIMIKHSAFLYTPQCKKQNKTKKNKKQNKTKKNNNKLHRKKMVLYMGRNNINSELTDKG